MRTRDRAPTFDPATYRWLDRATKLGGILLVVAARTVGIASGAGLALALAGVVLALCTVPVSVEDPDPDPSAPGASAPGAASGGDTA